MKYYQGQCGEWTRACPSCGVSYEYTSKYRLARAIKNNSICKSCNGVKRGSINKGRIVSDEMKKHLSECNSGKNNYWYGKHLSEEHKQKIRLRHKGKENLLAVKFLTGRKLKESTKLKMRQIRLERLSRLKIPGNEDEGARMWFKRYNKAYKANCKITTFKQIGYIADGYDIDNHTWIEFDTRYHDLPSVAKKDLIRQINIVKYFEDLGEPLNEFKRFAVSKNELKVVYRGYQYC